MEAQFVPTQPTKGWKHWHELSLCIMGTTDMYPKNFSLIQFANEEMALYPAYDLVYTKLVMKYNTMFELVGERFLYGDMKEKYVVVSVNNIEKLK